MAKVNGTHKTPSFGSMNGHSSNSKEMEYGFGNGFNFETDSDEENDVPDVPMGAYMKVVNKLSNVARKLGELGIKINSPTIAVIGDQVN